MDYKRADEIIRRTKSMYDAGKGALIQVKDISGIKVPTRALDSFGLPDNMETYLDYLVENQRLFWKTREQVLDDIIPSLTARYGIAEHSAFMGGEVSFTENTSWHHKYIEDYSNYTLAKVDETNIWRNLVIEGMRYLKNKVKDEFFIRYRGADGPLDIVNALRGNDIFYDFYDEEEGLMELASKCTDAIIYMLKQQQSIVTEYKGFVISGFDVIMPKGYAGHLSVDATTMLSDEMFRQFEIPFLQRIADNFDGLFFHIHSVGSHVIPAVCEIDKIKFLEISNDPNAPRSIEIYKKYEDVLSEKTVIVTLNQEEIIDYTSFLKDKKVIVWYDAKNLEDAKKAVDLVRTRLG
ncbi:MAG TPA: uroporphyrinogen decarboxylase family protein [Clostridia bacterium]|nr:uroporphyrinogen decarboxylase family protein [Clostridia bacterium]HQM39834.1 uroporphyrinogen decarboxylase family protein [Clostridia bacterium]